MRDIFKQWYIKGINGRINTVEKVYKWLLEETRGYHTVFIGSSAGAYASILFGGMIGADLQFAFSPQLNLIYQQISKNPLLYDNYEYNNISKYILQSHNLYIFYSKNCLDDKNDINLAQYNKADIVLFKNDFHGIPFKLFALPSVINMDVKRLEAFRGRTYNPWWFSLRYMDVICFVKWVIKILKYKLGIS